jgi:hypothetical protein
MTDAEILAEENTRLRAENAQIPRLERRNRWDRFLLISMAVITFVGIWFGRIYWEIEGSRIACPEIIKPAVVDDATKVCKDAILGIDYNGNGRCPHPDHTGKYLYRSNGNDLLICNCSRTEKP